MLRRGLHRTTQPNKLRNDEPSPPSGSGLSRSCQPFFCIAAELNRQRPKLRNSSAPMRTACGPRVVAF